MSTNVKYVGKKERKVDNVAGTDLVFDQGEVIEIADDTIAAKFLEHPNIWQATKEKATRKHGAVVARSQEPQQTEELPVLPNVNPEAMDRDALVAFAKAHFNRDFNPRMVERTVRAEVVKMIRAHNQSAGPTQ